MSAMDPVRAVRASDSNQAHVYKIQFLDKYGMVMNSYNPRHVDASNEIEH